MPHRSIKYIQLLPLLAAGGLAAAHAAVPALESSVDMVVTAQHSASEVGAGILAQGGNAIDAAVAPSATRWP